VTAARPFSGGPAGTPPGNIVPGFPPSHPSVLPSPDQVTVPSPASGEEGSAAFPLNAAAQCRDSRAPVDSRHPLPPSPTRIGLTNPSARVNPSGTPSSRESSVNIRRHNRAHPRGAPFSRALFLVDSHPRWRCPCFATAMACGRWRVVVVISLRRGAKG